MCVAATIMHLAIKRAPFSFYNLAHAVSALPHVKAPKLPDGWSEHFRQWLASCFNKVTSFLTLTLTLTLILTLFPTLAFLVPEPDSPSYTGSS